MADENIPPEADAAAAPTSSPKKPAKATPGKLATPLKKTPRKATPKKLVIPLRAKLTTPRKTPKKPKAKSTDRKKKTRARKKANTKPDPDATDDEKEAAAQGEDDDLPPILPLDRDDMLLFPHSHFGAFIVGTMTLEDAALWREIKHQGEPMMTDDELAELVDDFYK